MCHPLNQKNNEAKKDHPLNFLEICKTSNCFFNDILTRYVSPRKSLVSLVPGSRPGLYRHIARSALQVIDPPNFQSSSGHPWIDGLQLMAPRQP